MQLLISVTLVELEFGKIPIVQNHLSKRFQAVYRLMWDGPKDKWFYFCHVMDQSLYRRVGMHFSKGGNLFMKVFF